VKRRYLREVTRRDWTLGDRTPIIPASFLAAISLEFTAISLIKMHLLRAGSFLFVASSPPGRIVNCLIDKITVASYMRRVSLTLPRSLST